MLLKEAQSQIRERWALTTHVCSDLCLWPERPPLEALFKGGKVVGLRVDATLQRLREEEDLAPLTWFSVAIGPKGSYRKAQILQHLDRHLPAMTPGRPWRLLLCEVLSAQMDDEVVAAAANRGYVLAWHRGGCTVVLQCNDALAPASQRSVPRARDGGSRGAGGATARGVSTQRPRRLPAGRDCSVGFRGHARTCRGGSL